MSRTVMVAGTLMTILAACFHATTGHQPTESYVRPPAVPPSASEHVFGRHHMVHFYDVPGEYGYALEGRDYGFSALSVITTATHPGGGPPLHAHDTEEAHVLQQGRYTVLIGDRRFDVTGPAVVRIPARVSHTFVNTSERVIHVVGILPGDSITYRELGPNPLLEPPHAPGSERLP